jgi:hypothetical protein
MAGSSSRYIRYLLTKLIIVLFLLVTPFVLLQSHGYRRHVYYLWHPLVDEKLNARRLNADILFVGDSSLLMGLQPEVIKQRTGLSAHNLGVPGEAFCMASEVLLSSYLANNRTPKLLILYMSPQTNCSAVASSREAAGAYDNMITLGLSHQNDRLIALLLSHPSYVPIFALNSWYLMLTNFDPTGVRYNTALASLRAGGGHFPTPVNVPLKACSNSDPGIPMDIKFMRQFQREHADFGGRFGIYLNPMPDCDPRYARFKREAAGVADNILERLPHDLFTYDTAHLLPTGAEQNSRSVANFLSEFIQGRTNDGAPFVQKSWTDTTTHR